MPESVSSEFLTAAEIMPTWREALFSGAPPRRFPIGRGDLSQFELGPGRLTLLGGAPGAGKTAFAMQAAVDALRLSRDLRVLVCNVEMAPQALLDRQLARLSGVDGSAIRLRYGLDDCRPRLESGLATIASVADRIAFCTSPFTWTRISAAVARFSAELLLVDYLQRVRSDEGRYDDSRAAVNQLMDRLRRLAEGGAAVLAISAVGRSRDRGGRASYSGESLSLASFRNSSELEYGADDAYIFVQDGDRGRHIRLKHLKARYGAQRDLVLEFHRSCQRFSEPPSRDGDVGPAEVDLPAYARMGA